MHFNCSSSAKLPQQYHIKNYTLGKQALLKLEALNSKMCFPDVDFSLFYDLQFNRKRNFQQTLRTFMVLYYITAFQIVKRQSLTPHRDQIATVDCIKNSKGMDLFPEVYFK